MMTILDPGTTLLIGLFCGLILGFAAGTLIWFRRSGRSTAGEEIMDGFEKFGKVSAHFDGTGDYVSYTPKDLPPHMAIVEGQCFVDGLPVGKPMSRGLLYMIFGRWFRHS